MAIPILSLGPSHRSSLSAHFLALEPESLRLRFGHRPSAEWLEGYVARLDFDRDALFGAFDDQLRLVGVAHLAVMDDMAEIGVSVLPDQRGHGMGQALFNRAADHARNKAVTTLFTHCLAENGAMMAIARKNGMAVVRDAGEAEAYLTLPPPDPASITQEMLSTRWALFDFVLKSQLAAGRVITDAVNESVAPHLAQLPPLAEVPPLPQITLTSLFPSRPKDKGEST